jgi:energy-coupling factor transporter ATP-binding protein EcfA2
MKLTKIDYSEYKNTIYSWHLIDCTLGDINLIVGKNAIGKTRLLNVINGLAKIFSSETPVRLKTGKFSAEFDLNETLAKYSITFNDLKVNSEKFSVGNKKYINRRKDGKGYIDAIELGQRINFQIPLEDVVVSSRRDQIQHPFLEDLYLWGKNLYKYDFGTPLGKDQFLSNISSQHEGLVDNEKRNKPSTVDEAFLRGKKRFGEKFTNQIIKDMHVLGYELHSIGIEQISKYLISDKVSSPSGIYVKEKNLLGNTNQFVMSQGMFRALSIIIQINYSILSNIPSCILIDDIGEGLDFERSSSLIRLLINKAKETKFQLVMTSNDRFVMNNVPLEYWIILGRTDDKIVSYNYRNSKTIFDEFKFTGLSNFDLFTSKYYLGEKNYE